ncbi:hypothetical protein C8R45DRAFT_1208894 [Mycena sanguinolenta]|nr:hypothetical protein C8R45DRAFT_1208894 [Mycena sanguinolenta]
MPTTLIVGATRGLGTALALAYAHAGHTVYTTARASSPPTSPAHANITWIPAIDISTKSGGQRRCRLSRARHRVRGMYTTCVVGPVGIVQALVAAGKITTAVAGAAGGKIILISSGAASITLRHAPAGGGNYAHHAFKAALNKAVEFGSEGAGRGGEDCGSGVHAHGYDEECGVRRVLELGNIGTFEAFMRDFANDLPEDKDAPVRLPW